jgi:hypothetical protein
MLWIGVAPNTFLKPSEPALREVLTEYKARLASPTPTTAALRAPAGAIAIDSREAR